MVEIRNNYSQLDHNAMNRESENEYVIIKILAEAAAKKKRKIKVKGDE